MDIVERLRENVRVKFPAWVIQKEAADTIEKLRVENKELKASSEWQSIESAPKDGTEIICWDGYIIERVTWLRGDWHVVNGWFHAINPESLNSDNWNDPPEYCLAKPTHWQPLPTPPKGVDDET